MRFPDEIDEGQRFPDRTRKNRPAHFATFLIDGGIEIEDGDGLQAPLGQVVLEHRRCGYHAVTGAFLIGHREKEDASNPLIRGGERGKHGNSGREASFHIEDAPAGKEFSQGEVLP